MVNWKRVCVWAVDSSCVCVCVCVDMAGFEGNTCDVCICGRDAQPFSPLAAAPDKMAVVD